MDIENSLLVAKGEEVERRVEWKAGVSRCKLLYTEWINNKVLLYSTENNIQCSMINSNWKEYIQNNVHICITESLCSTAVINTTL